MSASHVPSKPAARGPQLAGKFGSIGGGWARHWSNQSRPSIAKQVILLPSPPQLPTNKPNSECALLAVPDEVRACAACVAKSSARGKCIHTPYQGYGDGGGYKYQAGAAVKRCPDEQQAHNGDDVCAACAQQATAELRELCTACVSHPGVQASLCMCVRCVLWMGLLQEGRVANSGLVVLRRHNTAPPPKHTQYVYTCPFLHPNTPPLHQGLHWRQGLGARPTADRRRGARLLQVPVQQHHGICVLPPGQRPRVLPPPLLRRAVSLHGRQVGALPQVRALEQNYCCSAAACAAGWSRVIDSLGHGGQTTGAGWDVAGAHAAGGALLMLGDVR